MSRRRDRARIAELERDLDASKGDAYAARRRIGELGDELGQVKAALNDEVAEHQATLDKMIAARSTLAANAADAATAQQQVADLTARVEALIEQSAEDQAMIARAAERDAQRSIELADRISDCDYYRNGRNALQATLDDHLGLIDRLVAAGDALHASALRKSPAPRKLKPVQAWAELSASVKGEGRQYGSADEDGPA